MEGGKYKIQYIPFEEGENRLNMLKIATGKYTSLKNDNMNKELIDLCYLLMSVVCL
jgi:hypothetical protein